MQLRRRGPLAGIALFVAAAAAASTGRADPGTTVALDTLLYSDSDRVVVVSPQATVRHELDDDGGEVAAHAVVDVVSAASVDVISQATRGFTEERYEADLEAARRIAGVLGSVSYRYSGEPDYVSHGGTVGLERRLGTPDTVLAASYGLTYDTVGRRGTAFDAWSRRLASHTFEVALTQVLGPRTLLRLVGTFVAQAGYLAKPYRHVPLFTQAAVDAAGDGLGLDTFHDVRLQTMPTEQVPGRRYRPAIAALLVRHLGARDAVLRASYRFYADDWGMTAHTVDVAIDAAFGAHWRFGLHDRTHLQRAVAFWERAYVVPDETVVPRWRTLDRELGASLSETLGLGARWEHGALAAYLDFDAMYSRFFDFLLLDDRLALIAQLGLRWTP